MTGYILIATQIRWPELVFFPSAATALGAYAYLIAAISLSFLFINAHQLIRGRIYLFVLERILTSISLCILSLSSALFLISKFSLLHRPIDSFAMLILTTAFMGALLCVLSCEREIAETSSEELSDLHRRSMRRPVIFTGAHLIISYGLMTVMVILGDGWGGKPIWEDPEKLFSYMGAISLAPVLGLCLLIVPFIRQSKSSIRKLLALSLIVNVSHVAILLFNIFLLFFSGVLEGLLTLPMLVVSPGYMIFFPPGVLWPTLLSVWCLAEWRKQKNSAQLGTFACE